MKWEPGRQGTGYLKLKLWQGNSSDAYLIDYPANSHIPTHVDVVEGVKHFRINIRLWGPDNFRGKSLCKFWVVNFFRPDIMPHSVEKVSSRRIILSIGWVV